MNQPLTRKRTKKEKPTCNICVEEYNKSTRLPIECPYCHYEVCRTCCETYILNESEVKCMNTECAKTWTRKHIREIFTLVFINGQLKEHQQKVLFDRERALLPATQPIIEGKILARKIDEELTQLRNTIAKLRQDETVLLHNKSVALNRRTGERNVFVRACPEEECRGFLSSQWKCGICEKWVCPDCHIVKGYTRDADHECKEDDLATAKLLSTDTKPCPKCGTGIFKVDGCDQMWCTQCHTAFNWRSGRIEQTVHNPHYFEWMRRTGGGEAPRNPLDVPCGRVLDHHLVRIFSNMLRTHYQQTTNNRTVYTRIDNTIRFGIHLLHVERPTPQNYERRNEDLRVAYLMKEISEKEMQELLQKDDKRHHKNQEIADVYTLLANTVGDILYRFLNYLEENKHTPPENIDETILNEIHTIVDYSNECMLDISHTYSSSKMFIEYNLRVIRGQRAAEQLKIMSSPHKKCENCSRFLEQTQQMCSHCGKEQSQTQQSSRTPLENYFVSDGTR